MQRRQMFKPILITTKLPAIPRQLTRINHQLIMTEARRARHCLIITRSLRVQLENQVKGNQMIAVFELVKTRLIQLIHWCLNQLPLATKIRGVISTVYLK